MNENHGLYKYGEKKIKNLNIDLWNEINKIQLFIPFKEKFYLLENSLNEPPKCECGNSVKFIDMLSGYRKFCSRRCMYDSNLIKEKRRKTSLENWGVDNPSKSKDVRNKVKETNINKFGNEWATQSLTIKNKIKTKFLENWGVDNPSKVKDIREKAKLTMLERYGVDHAMKSESIKSKFKENCIEKWGVDNPFKVKEIKDKIRDTMYEKWGVEFALQNNDIIQKMKMTNLQKWGFEFPTQNKEVIEKIKTNNLKKWGVDNPSKTDEIKEKIKKSILDKYNTLDLTKIDEINKKILKTNLENFQEKHVSKNEEYRKKYLISNHPNYIRYIDNGISLFECDNGENHQFEIYIDNFHKRLNSSIPICTICNPIGDLKSIKEKELFSFIKSIWDKEVNQSMRDGLEIDIYLPYLKLGFEFNGLYWHSEEHKKKQYHLDKTLYFQERGIRIIHIWEDSWSHKNEIIKSQIKNWIGITDNKIYARKCQVRLISNIESKHFLNQNHIQGHINSNVALGLYFKNELVSIMTFDHWEGRKKMSEYEWNLSRFCNKINTNIIGGASKLLDYFQKEFRPKRIISYADRDWSTGDLYKKLGFRLTSELKPDYKYIVNEKRVHKSRFKKSNLKIENISEYEYTKSKCIHRIWDCGKLKFEIEI